MTITIRRTRRSIVTGAVALLVLSGMLRLGAAPVEASAITATSTCQLGSSGVQCPTAPPPHADLLGQDALAAATPNQAAALRRLSAQAIDNTLTDHGLPAGDRDAVLGWARPDAQAELFALIVTAIKTPESERSADQQDAVAWMRELVRAKAERVAQQVGAEFATWSGRHLTDYWSLVNDPASTEADVRDFLSGLASPYDTADRSTATSGYCLYQPPESYQKDYQKKYDSSTFQTCYTPCTTPFGCQPVTPQYDDFVDWGTAAAIAADSASAEVGIAWSEIAESATFGSALMASVAGIAATAVLESVLPLGSLLPLFGSPITLVSDTLGFSVGEGFASAIGWTAAEAAAAGGAVAVVLMAVVIATLEGVKVANATELPGKLASLVVGSRTTQPDLGAQLQDPDQAAGILTLFVEATLPLPRLGGTCSGTNATTDLGTRPCLNPPELPAASASDPHFVLHDLDTGTTSTSPTLAVLDHLSGLTTTVRVHGSWFVGTFAGIDGQVQSLSMPYREPMGREHRVWLMRDAAGGYWFVGLSSNQITGIDHLDTCVADKTCWQSRTIFFLGPGGPAGHMFTASLEPSSPPVGTPSAVITEATGQPVEGGPITFRANGFRPGKAVFPVTYTWRFQRDGCGVPCTTVTSTGGPDGGAGTGPQYGDQVTGPRANGDEPTHTWQTSGTYAVQVTATDHNGTQAVTTLSVRVAGVPPVLSIDQGTTSARAGGELTLDGTIDHVGQLDDEKLAIDWGDGVVDEAEAGPGAVGLVGAPVTLTSTSPTRYGWEARHTYPQPGTYSGTVVVTDQAGHTDTRTFSVVVS